MVLQEQVNLSVFGIVVFIERARDFFWKVLEKRKVVIIVDHYALRPNPLSVFSFLDQSVDCVSFFS